MYSIHTGTLQYITPVHLSDEENTYRIPSFLLTWSVLVVVSSSGGRREGCHLLLARYQGGVGTILIRDRRLVGGRKLIGSFWLSELSRGNSIPAKIPVIIPVGHEETLKEQFHSAFRANPQVTIPSSRSNSQFYPRSPRFILSSLPDDL